MSYDSRKVERGQEYVDEIAIEFDCCKYVREPYLSQRILIVPVGTSLPPGGLGPLTVIGSANARNSLWGAYNGRLYGRKRAVSGETEIFRFTVSNDTTINVVERGLLGTPQVAIQEAIELLHEGEVNGSCRGFAQTCSNTDAYSPSEKTVFRFCSAPRVAGSIMFPGLYHQAVEYDSAEVDVGESIGSPAKLRVRLQDFEAGDENVVPYRDKRSSSGTWWGRMLARNPYMNGRKVVWRSGLRDAGTFGEPEWIERHFIIDSCSLSDEHVTISCLDPAILAEEKKAKMPVISPAQLSSPMIGAPTTFSYVNAPDYYFGAMSAAIYVRIDSEVIRATVSGPKQLTVSQRGYRSIAKDHDAGATIQDCVRFSGTHIIDAITFAMQSYTSIPASYIDNYAAVKTKIPTYDLDDCLITKPIPVQDFISAMIKLGNLIFYFNESTLKFVIDYIPELSIEPISINESEHIERSTVSVNPNTKEQWTRFAHIWAPTDVTSDAEENFAINYLAANLAVESSAKMGEVNEKKTFKNPFLTSSPSDSLIGAAYASRVVSGADKSPQIITATVNAENIGPTQSGNLKVGSIINLITKESQDIDGQPASELYQVLKIKGDAYRNFELKMRRYLSFQPESVSFVISSGAVNYVLSDHFAPTSPGTYTVYIDSGVEFGSNNVTIAAFSTGPHAVGVSLKIINRGSMLGMGGFGGNAGVSLDPAHKGGPGGTAFEALAPVQIDNGAGLIWAGGGGGRGQRYISPQGPGEAPVARKGGGGGQGYGYSTGGLNTNGFSYTDRASGGSKAGPGDNGGEWGTDGGVYYDEFPGSTGGLAGIAIKSNGNSVTIIAGNNDFNIRGRRT